MTAHEWREKHPDKDGNIRDYASIEQLLVLSNMESYNAIMIERGKAQAERLQELRKLAFQQLNGIKVRRLPQ